MNKTTFFNKDFMAKKNANSRPFGDLVNKFGADPKKVINYLSNNQVVLSIDDESNRSELLYFLDPNHSTPQGLIDNISLDDKIISVNWDGIKDDAFLSLATMNAFVTFGVTVTEITRKARLSRKPMDYDIVLQDTKALL